jgi:hypothetical protein
MSTQGTRPLHVLDSSLAEPVHTGSEALRDDITGAEGKVFTPAKVCAPAVTNPLAVALALGKLNVWVPAKLSTMAKSVPVEPADSNCAAVESALMLVSPVPAGIDHVPSPLQNVELVAPDPLLSFETGRFPIDMTPADRTSGEAAEIFCVFCPLSAHEQRSNAETKIAFFMPPTIAHSRRVTNGPDRAINSFMEILKPLVIKPFTESAIQDLRNHVREVRRAFDAPGAKYHDADHCEADKFNRWFWHNLPLLVEMHHSPELIKTAYEVFDRPLKPSYVFLSMYGPDGICPLHTDRPQCQFTIDLQVESDGQWPIFVDGEPYLLRDGEALAYSGTGQPHYRKRMSDGISMPNVKTPTFMNLAFFHFVPTNWMGRME